MTRPAPLAGYKTLANDATDQLELSRPVDLVLAEDWGMEPEPDAFTIYCPARDGEEHVLLHYIAHAKMLEDGWKQPVFRFDDRTDFLIVNRAADSFTDFWAYRVVADVFGPEHLLAYTDWVANTAAESIAEFLLQKREKHGFTDGRFRHFCLVFAADWFAMAPELLRPYFSERAELLVEGFENLRETGVSDNIPADVGARVEAVRAQYHSLRDAHALYRGIRGDRQETVFATYFETVWPEQPPAVLDGFVSPLSTGANSS